MEHFYKQFTVIDFLAIFAPGAAVVLAVHAWVTPLTGVLVAFFGEDGIARGLYFIVLSYFAGHLLGEATKFLERPGIPPWLRAYDAKAKAQYRDEVRKKALECGCIEAAAGDELLWRRVYYYVMARADCSRLRLMKGFFGLSRASAGALAVLAVIAGVRLSGAARAAAPAACAMTALLLLKRARRFSYIWQETCFESFLLCAKPESGKAA